METFQDYGAMNNSEWGMHRHSAARLAQSPGNDQREDPAWPGTEAGELMMENSFRGHRKFFYSKPQ